MKLVYKPYNPNKVFLITDSNVARLYWKKMRPILKEFDCNIVVVTAGENNKNINSLQRIYNDILNSGCTKKSFIVILGGGVIGNMGGFAASIIMRGIPFGYIPTTVMSMADSTTGGKQAINTEHGKNLLGVFNDPKFILIDYDFLDTLCRREKSCGIAECIKHSLCYNGNLNPDVENMIEETIILKQNVLRLDPLEYNEGKILVYGHTVGHAIETLSNGQLNHGESISIGMVCAARMSIKLGLATRQLLSDHLIRLRLYYLPTKIPKYISVKDIMEKLKFDKKNCNCLEMVLLTSMGKLHMINGRVGTPISKKLMIQVLKQSY